MPRFHYASLLLPFSLLTAAAWASGPTAAAEYSHRIWRTQDGLPQSQIRAIAQTSDGYLWIGTSGGLVRFDGVRFVVFDRSNTPALRDDSILSLVAGKDRSLWAGTEGGGLVHFKDGTFRNFGSREGLTNLFVRSFHEDRNSTAWVGTDRGFFRLAGSRMLRVDGTREVPVASVAAMAEAFDGTLWLGGPAGLFTERSGTLSPYPFSAAIRSICVARDGTVWFATGAGIRTLRPGATALGTPPGKLGETDARQIYEDAESNLWIGTSGDGLLRIQDGTVTSYREDHFLPDNSVLSLFQDREQNLWAGTQDGLVRLSKTILSTITTRTGLSANNVSTVYEDPANTLLISTVTGKIFRVEGQRAVPYSHPGLTDDIRAESVFQDSRGTLWLGTLNRGIARIEGGKATFYSTRDGLRSNQVRQFVEDSGGAIWIASGSGLVRWADARFQTYYLEDGLAYGGVRTILELHHGANRGDLLVGTDGGLNRVHERKIVRDPALSPLLGEKIWSILEEPDGTVWLGTRGGGLFRLKDGRVFRFQTKEGLPSNSIYQILNDRRGRLWMSSPVGIFSASLTDLQAVAEGKPGPVPMLPYGTAEGLESAGMKGGVQSAGCRAASGDLWFPSVKGAVRIDPSQLQAGRAAAPIVESMLADDVNVPLTPSVKIPAGRTRLEIDYTACSFRSPERITFQYKLEGFDQSWTLAAKRRVAYYTNLPPGDYRFRVVALDASAEQQPAEASIAFRWEPRYYQTAWFYLVCVLLAGMAVWFSLRLYTQQTKGRYAMILAERTRLAREMHDTLIQGCVGVSTLLEAAGSMEHSGDANARNLVDQARTQVRLTLEEARQAVWDLRHTSLHGGLADNLTSFARQLGGENRIDVQVQVSGPPSSVEKRADKDLLLIAREAIRNALAHGQPEHIVVGLHFERSRVKLEVIDDGAGFDPATARGAGEGHYGLLGMRERVEQLGGTFQVDSAPGNGAKVMVSVPYHG